MFLTLLVLSSFLQSMFPDSLWWWWFSGVYLVLVLACLSAYLGSSVNVKALTATPWVFYLLVFKVVWIAASLFVAIGNPATDLIASSRLDGLQLPPWYQAQSVWSFVPEKTRILLFSEIGVLSFLILAVLMISTRQRALQLVTVLILIGVTHAGLGMGSKYLNLYLIDTAQLDGNFGAAIGLFVNRNHFAAYLSLSLFGGLTFVIRYFLKQKSRFKRVAISSVPNPMMMLAFISSALILLAMSLSQSRAGFFSFFLSGLLLMSVTWGLSFVGAKSAGRASVKPAFGAFVFLFIVGLCALFLDDSLRARTSPTNLVLGERLEQWRVTWDVIQQQMVFGYGGNSYTDVFQLFREDSVLRPLIYNQAHNDYLHIWLELGLVGLLLWLATLVLVFRRGIIEFVKNDSTLVRAGLLASLIVLLAALIQSSVDFNLQLLSIRILFFLVVAVVLSLPCIEHQRVPKKLSEK